MNVWNGIDSDLEFDEVSANPDMTDGTDLTGEGIWATSQVTRSGGVITDSDIKFNTRHTWGGRAGDDWWKFRVKDYLSTAIHGAGRSIRPTHDSGSELVKSGHGIGDICRMPSAHDMSTVQEKY